MWGTPLFGVFAALCAFGWNYYGLKIKELEKVQNELKYNSITISPEIIHFTQANAFKGSNVELYEKYTFTVYNPSSMPSYNIWIEISSDEINIDLIKFEPAKKESVSSINNTNWRQDTYIINFVDTMEKHMKLLAINRLGQSESYEYAVTIVDKKNLIKGSSVQMKLIKSSSQCLPSREGSSNNESGFVFSNPLPKSGKILGFEMFSCQ